MRKPVVRSQRVAIAMGIVLFVAGSWFLYQAWEARGQRTPRILRPFTAF